MKFLRFFGIWIISVCLSPLAHAGAAGVPDAIAGELAKAKSEGKLLLVDVYGDWCPWCTKMDQTLNDEGVKGAMDANYRYVKLDIGEFDRHQDLLKQYNVKAIPHFLVFDPNGELVAEQRGYLPPDNFKNVLAQSVFKRQLSVVRQPGIVVYVAVKADRTLEDGTSETDVRMMRIESSPNGAPGDWVQTS